MAGLSMIWMAQAAIAVTTLPAGPMPPPEPPAATPVEAARQQYERRYGPQVSASVRCVPKPGQDITVCARRPGTRSEYELPLPEERGKDGEVRRVAGEPAKAAAGGSPGRGAQALSNGTSLGLVDKVVGGN